MNKETCTVLFTGGLGNQLFQFVFMLYQKKILGFRHAMYNTSSYSFQPIHAGFQADHIFKFDSFVEDKKNYYTPFYRMLKRASRESKLFKPISPIVYERDYKEGCRQRIYEGYWQKCKYYEAVKKILPDYTKDIAIDFPNKELMQNVTETPSVLVHVRRGDYLVTPGYLDLTKGDYYPKALSYIKEHMENPVFYVFSDDIAWCKTYFGNKNNFVYIEYEDQSPINDLALMSCCKAAIIANSSFSWWGAVLGGEKLVLHSPLYFKSGGQPELYPQKWIEVKHIV